MEGRIVVDSEASFIVQTSQGRARKIKFSRNAGLYSTRRSLWKPVPSGA